MVIVFNRTRKSSRDPINEWKHCSNSPHFIYHVEVHCLFSCAAFTTKYKTEVFLCEAGLANCQDISLQRKETQQFHQWGLLVTMVKYFSLLGRLHSKTLMRWSRPLSFQCQVGMFYSNLMNHICNLKLERNSISKSPVKLLTRMQKNELLLLPYSEALCIPT